MMAEAKHNLERIQRWLQAVITHPGGAAEGVDSDAARQELPVSAGEVERVVLPSSQLTSLERLEIYAGAYYARLVECFRDEFPALRYALEDETFDAFVLGYLQTYPSRSYTLGNLSADFSRFLDETRPVADDGEPGETEWADFLVDLATVERLYSDVFDGPGDEQVPALDLDALARISPERWGDVVLLPAASLRLVKLRSPVHEFISAVRHGQEAMPPSRAPTWLAVWRRDYAVRRDALTERQHALLASVVEGRTLAEGVTAAATLDCDEPELSPDQLSDWFSGWSAARLFREARLPPGA